LPETSNRKLPDTVEEAMQMKFEKHVKTHTEVSEAEGQKLKDETDF
jgi:hypothetical protein